MRVLRPLLALACLGLAGFEVWSLVCLLHDIAEITSIRPIPYNVAVQRGVELLTNQAGSCAQLTTLLLGALAALWIAKGDEPRLALSRRLWPEIVMWCTGVLMLGTGLYCYHEYLSRVASALEVGGVTSPSSISIPDVFNEKFESLLTEQFRLLVFGTILSGLAILSVRQTSGGQHAGS